jgi:hypothetical protein
MAELGLAVVAAIDSCIKYVLRPAMVLFDLDTRDRADHPIIELAER